MSARGIAGCPPTLLIDANLLLLLVVGSADRSLIESFKRTRAYTREDFDLLLRLVARFPKVVTTPNVLTEVSNLAGQLRDPTRRAIRQKLSRLITDIGEDYIPA
jgi:hypothetical protein